MPRIYDSLLDRWASGDELTIGEYDAMSHYIDIERRRNTSICLTVEEVKDGHATKYIAEHTHFGAGSDMPISELPAFALATAQILEDEEPDRPGWHATIHIRDCECIDDGADY